MQTTRLLILVLGLLAALALTGAAFAQTAPPTPGGAMMMAQGTPTPAAMSGMDHMAAPTAMAGAMSMTPAVMQAPATLPTTGGQAGFIPLVALCVLALGVLAAGLRLARRGG